MTPSEFHAKYYGWGQDVDGVAGIQCVDLFKEFLRIIGVPTWSAPIGGDGYADNIWFNRSRWAAWFTFVTEDYKNGDIVIFPHSKRGGWTHPSSHVCFWYDHQEFGTNQGGDRHACLKGTKWADALGALRYKYWEEEKPMELKDGLQEVTYSGVTYEVVKAPEGYGLRMLSSKTVADITKIVSTDAEVLAKVNANYFNLQTGEHYGVEQSDIFDNAPKNSAYLAFAQLNDGGIVECLASDYWYAKKDVQFGCTPYACRIHGGALVYDRSTAYGDKDDTKTSQTAVFLVGDRWCLAVTATGQTCCPRDITAMAQTCGATECIIMDSGGSTQMTYGDRKVVYTGRKIPNVFALVKTTDAADQDTSTDETADLEKQIQDLQEQLAEQTKLAQENLETAKAYEPKAEKYDEIEKIVKG